MTIDVKDAGGVTRTIETLPPVGQAPAAASLPVVHASNDPLVSATGAAGDAAWSGSGAGGVIAILKAIFTAKGQAAAVASLPVVQASDDPLVVATGGRGDGAWSGSGNGSIIAVLKALFVPKGQAAAAASLPVVTATDDPLVMATGARADAAWGGTGAGGVIAILKALWSAIVGTSSADNGAAVSPSDTVDLATVPKAIYVGGAGNLAVRGADGTSVTFAVTAGQILPFRARRVLATGTTATGIVALT